MKCVSLAGVFLTAALSMPSTALAWGAITVGAPPDVVHQGFTYGMAVNQATEDLARERALKSCHDSSGNAPAASPYCSVVTTFYRQCVVLAWDPAAGTTGVGWAVAPALETATRQAMDNCRATAGAERQQFCVTNATRCDTN